MGHPVALLYSSKKFTSHQSQKPHPLAKGARRVGQPGESFYSVRRAFMGSMLAARLAGMKPAMAAEVERTRTAAQIVKGS